VRRLPWILVLSRVALAPVVIGLALADARGAIVAAMAWALAADVADGKIARRLGVATDRLRRADSAADLAFWLAALAAAWMLEPEGFGRRAPWIVLVLALEGALHATSWLRFGRGPASHAWSSKAWGLLLCASLVSIVGLGRFDPLFAPTIALGIVSLLDGLAILLLLPEWTRDVPSFRSALALRRGHRGSG